MNKVKVKIDFGAGSGFNFRSLEHEYNVPYERDDDFILRSSERDPYSPTSTYEPNIGFSLYADVNFEYNYYVKDYEVLTQGVDENTLPSLNYYLLHQEGHMPEQLYNDLFYFGANQVNSASQKKFLSNAYFEEYANRLLSGLVLSEQFNPEQSNPGSTGEQDVQKVVEDNNLRNEYISREAIQVYADLENKREMFPYFAKVHMTGMPMSQFVGILEEAGLGKIFVDFLIMHRETELNNVYTNQIEGKTVVPYTLDAPIKAYTYSTFQTHMREHSGLSQSYESASSTGTDSCSILENAIRNQIGAQRLADYIERNKRSSETETVAYRLEKYADDGRLIYSKYFLNHTDLEDFKLHDTQVIYGKRYSYLIKAINLVFRAQGSQSSVAFFLEEPYYRDYFKVLDSPPVQPDVEIVTYRGVSDKILIMLNQMIDQKVEKPILINPSDVSGTFDPQWEAQKITPENPILFESDDPTYFELFRLEDKPHSYQDFVNGKYVVIGQENRTSAAYHDMISPNKTYYYTFRALDMHGHVSNPTAVYEFRLNKEGETLYPTLRVVDFKPKDPPTQKNISFKKYLKIGLSPSHYQIPELVTSQIENISQNDIIDIGNNKDDNLLTPTTNNNPRKFKFRIRSKNTGKLIDINITFKKNGVFIE